MRKWALAATVAFLAACGGGGGGDAGPGDPGPDPAPDVPADTADVPADTAPDPTPGDTAGDADAAADTPADVPGDVPADAPDAPDAADPEGPPYVRWVNPFIGTGGAIANVGSAFPGATAPLGLVKVGPDTKTVNGASQFHHCAGYHYEDDLVATFSHTHLHGTGAPDYGNIGIMPVSGTMTDAKTKRYGLDAPFTHEGEVAEAGYYAVTLTDPKVRAEFTATVRCAHHRYTWLDGAAEGTLALDPTTKLLSGRSSGGEVTVDAEAGTVEGWNHANGDFSGRYGGFRVHFSIRFDRPFQDYGTWLDGQVQARRERVATSADPASFGAWFVFDTGDDPTVEVQVCLSMVDLEGARKNAAAEMAAWDFEGTRAATRDAWERELSRIEVTGGTVDEKVNFYTAVYHVLQMPTTWSDADGRFRSFDRDNPVPHQADGWTYYTDMSFWDTFRTQHPLLTLVWPERQRDMVRSLARMMITGGWSPMWPMGAGDTGSMIGQHAASVVADTVLKGMADFDAPGMTDALQSMYDVLKKNADGPATGPGAYGNRGCIEEYLDKGYCPGDASGESVSLTLEYAFNDYCLAELAKAMGNAEDEARWRERSGYWKNLWDPTTGFFRARNADGTLTPGNFDPTEWNLGRGHYVEGTAWQWLWFVPHDEAGLRETLGGDATFLQRLTRFMDETVENFDFLIPGNYYFHGNEPDLHAPFLAIRAGQPDLAQRWSRWLLDTNYLNAYDGMVGNDDAGTLAAWYVFAAVGLYPWACVPGYYVTAPIFDRAVLHLPAGDLVVEAPGAAGRRDGFIDGATFGGAPLETLWIDHADLAKGGTLSLTLKAKAPQAARPSPGRAP